MADVNTLSAQARSLWSQVQSIFSSAGYETTLTSAGRSADHNATIPGASSTSQHIGGNAFDFQVRDNQGRIVDPLQVQATLASQGLTYGQNIAEYGLGMNPRNHLSVATERLQGQTLVARGGKYTPNKPSLTSTLVSSARSDANEFIASSLRAMGLDNKGAYAWSDHISGTLAGAGEAMQAPANALTSGLQSWILRGAVAIVAILLIAAAIFSIAKGNNPITVAKSALT